MQAELATSPASTNKRSRNEFEGDTPTVTPPADVKVTPTKHCGMCDKQGHNSRTCPDQICEGCHLPGHSQQKCPTNPLPKAKRQKTDEASVDFDLLSKECLMRLPLNEINQVISNQLSATTAADLARFIRNTTQPDVASENGFVAMMIQHNKSTPTLLADIIIKGDDALGNDLNARLIRGCDALTAQQLPRQKLRDVAQYIVDSETDKTKLFEMASVAFTTTAPTKPRHCGLCHGEGHNQRKCPLNKEVGSAALAVVGPLAVPTDTGSDSSESVGDEELLFYDDDK